MTDLRKYILDESETPFCRLVKEIMQRTHCDVLDNLESLATVDDDELYTVTLELSEDLLQGAELQDFGEWGTQQATVDRTGYGAFVNPLLYALIMSVFEESQVSFRVIYGTEQEVVWNVCHAAESYRQPIPPWEQRVLDLMADAYRENVQAYSDLADGELPEDSYTGLLGSILLIKFDDSCDAEKLLGLLAIIGDWIPGYDDLDVYGMDSVGFQPEYIESNLYCNFPAVAEDLIAFLSRYGHKKKKKLSHRTCRTAERIAGELRSDNSTCVFLIREILGLNETKTEVLL